MRGAREGAVSGSACALSALCSERMGKFWECVVVSIVCRACRVNLVPDALVSELELL